MNPDSNSPGTGFKPMPLDLVFEHTRVDGGSERLVLAGHICTNPQCDCREVNYYGFVVPGSGSADLVGRKFDRRVLDLALNVDTGKISVVRKAQPDVLRWLEEELQRADPGALRRTFDEVRASIRELAQEEWKNLDWSGWKPGMRVSWSEAHPTDGHLVCEVDGREFLIEEEYCVTDEGQCGEVYVTGQEIVGDQLQPEPLFSAAVVPANPERLKLEAAPERRALAQKVWDTFAAREGFFARLAQREQWMRETLGPELIRIRARTPFVRRQAVAPNAPCPCGSGKKHKRCCGR